MAKWSVKLSTYNIIYEPRSTIKSQALADFVADFSDDLKKEVDIEVEQLRKENVGKWILYTDGASNAKRNKISDHAKIATGGHHTPCS